MPNGNGTLSQNENITINVRATVILRIPDLDTNELTALYKMIQTIIAQFGGEFDVTTSPQPPQPNIR